METLTNLSMLETLGLTSAFVGGIFLFSIVEEPIVKALKMIRERIKN